MSTITQFLNGRGFHSFEGYSGEIAKQVDGVVLIVYGGRTRIKAFESTVDVLNSVQTKILGVVINKIPNFDSIIPTS